MLKVMRKYMFMYNISSVGIGINVSTWSRGMIPASGAGGPGFNPRSGPHVLLPDVQIYAFHCVYLYVYRHFFSTCIGSCVVIPSDLHNTHSAEDGVACCVFSSVLPP